MKSSHIHKYQKIRFRSGHLILKCMISGCPHFLPHLETALSRECACWRCGETIILDKENLRAIKPTCAACKEQKRIKLQSRKSLALRS